MVHMETFVTSKLAAGLSSKTVDWYCWLLTQYRDFCVEHGIDCRATSSIETFLAGVRRKGGAPATVAAYYRSLRVYFRWLQRRGLCEWDPMEVVERPRMPRQRRQHVSLAEFRRLYDGIEGEGWLDWRDRALVIVMFFSGLRVGEAIGLQRADIDLGRRLIMVRSGKGGHARVVPCAPLLAEPLERYLETHPAWKRGRRATTLWLSSDGYDGVRGPLTSEGVRVMLRRRCAAVGLRHINPHQFRHGFAMTLLNAGMELSAVSAAMGHSSQAITEQVYAAWLTEGLAREYDEALKRILPEA